MRTYWRNLRSFDRNIVLFLASWALAAFGYFGVQGVLLNLFLLRLGYGTAFIGVLIGAGQIVWALFALPAGAIGLRIGIRTALVSAHLTVTLAMSLLLLVEQVPVNAQPAWLIGTWMLLWVGASMNTVNSIPYLMAVSRGEQRNYAFATQQAVVALAAFAGSIIAGLLPALFANWFGLTLDAPAPYRAALWLAPMVYLGAAVAMMSARQVTLGGQQAVAEPGQPSPVRTILLLGVIVFLISTGEGSVRAFFNVYLDSGLSLFTGVIGTMMGVAQLLPVVAAFLVPILLHRVGAGRTLIASTAGLTFCLLLIGAVPHWFVAGNRVRWIVLVTMAFANTSRNHLQPGTGCSPLAHCKFGGHHDWAWPGLGIRCNLWWPVDRRSGFRPFFWLAPVWRRRPRCCCCVFTWP